MSLEKIVAEALAGRPLEMKEAFEEEIQTRIQARLEAEYMNVLEAKSKEDDEDEDEDLDESEDDEDVRVDEGFFDSLKRGYTTGLQNGLKKKIKPEHHSSYDIAGVKSTSDATSILQKAKQSGHHINEDVEHL